MIDRIDGRPLGTINPASPCWAPCIAWGARQDPPLPPAQALDQCYGNPTTTFKEIDA